jgi:single-strand DNA-binding protein
MSEGLNRCILLGNLGADPELRYTQGGQAVMSLRMATTESYLDGDRNRKERTDWHNVVVWGKRAEGLSKILRKGSSILVEGSLRTSSYESRDGGKRYKTEVNARNVLLTGGRPQGQQQGQGFDQRDQDTRRHSPPQGQQQGASQGDHNGYSDNADPDDDIPF